MTQFQLGLAMVGGLVLIAIVAYNIWIVRRNQPKRPKMPKVRSRSAADVPPGQVPVSTADVTRTGRKDPVLDIPTFTAGKMYPQVTDTGGDASARSSPLEHERNPELAEQSPTQPMPLFRPYMQHAGLDTLIDSVVTMRLENPMGGDAALEVIGTASVIGSKPYVIEGQHVVTGLWEVLRSDQRYRQFRAGVQLANRAGAIKAGEFSEFIAKAQAFANAIHATPKLPDTVDELDRARVLDQFASERDVLVVVVLRARHTPWTADEVREQARKWGFEPIRMQGRMLLSGRTGSLQGMPPTLTLDYEAQQQSALNQVSLSLDVALVRREEQAFARMCEVARDFCEEMDAVLCDEAGEPLLDATLELIATRLEHLYEELDSNGLAAGSTLARRLFS